MDQVLGVIPLDISEQKICEDENEHNSSRHTDLMCYQCSSTWFVYKVDEHREVETRNQNLQQPDANACLQESSRESQTRHDSSLDSVIRMLVAVREYKLLDRGS
jgi:hypothetical protein